MIVSFENRVEPLCKKVSQKLNALLQFILPLSFPQRKLLLNAFITSQFSNALIVRMFPSRKLSHRIDNIHEGALRLVYKDKIPLLMNVWSKPTLFRFVIVICKCWPSKFLK